jgi:6-pyruvoyl-tetrahydropterin synthase
MAVDFTAVKGALKILEDSILDHTDLNAALKEENPTAEFLAQWVYKHLSPSAVQWGVSLASVRVWESPECSVEYTPDVFMWDVQ